jgi:hypothetical protein
MREMITLWKLWKSVPPALTPSQHVPLTLNSCYRPIRCTLMRQRAKPVFLVIPTSRDADLSVSSNGCVLIALTSRRVALARLLTASDAVANDAVNAMASGSRCTRWIIWKLDLQRM